MHRIDDPSAVAALPAPKQPGTPGFFTSGSSTVGQEATIVSDDWANAVQEELSYVIEQSGLTLSKTDRTQLFQALARLTRLRLNANMTFYVSPSGSDTNDGLTQATAWASIYHAYNFIRDRIDTNGFQTVIQLANGTYSGAQLYFPVIGPSPIIRGNLADPSQVLVNNPTGAAITAAFGAMVTADSFTVSAAGPAGDYGAVGSGLLAGQDGSIVVSNMHFGACSLAHLQTYNSGSLGFVSSGQSYTIVGSAPMHYYANGGTITVVDGIITLLGAPSFSTAFAFAQGGTGQIDAWSNVWNGTATGKRYHADRSSSIIVGGAGANYFPGTIAGDVANGGFYG